MNYYDNIKELLINNEITKKVKNYSINKSDLNTYYNVGKELSEAGKHYGEGIIREYSKRLTNEIGKGYSKRSLELMRKFYNFQKTQTVSAQLTWSHYCEILTIDDNIKKYNHFLMIIFFISFFIKDSSFVINEYILVTLSSNSISLLKLV